ncbi:MAG: CBS domain-containing protein [Myxococcota bacterium]|jgi:CBS domain-containing protein
MHRIRKVVRELLPKRETPIVAPDAPVSEVIATMRARNVSGVLVSEGGKNVFASAVGIVTDRDIAFRVAGELVPMSTPATQVMSTPVRRMNADETLVEAISAMAAHGLSNIPVVNADGIVEGVLCSRDVLDHLSEVFDAFEAAADETNPQRILATTPVSELSRQAPVRVKMRAPLLGVVQAMRENGRSSVLVEGKDGRLLGVFTQNDLVRRVDLSELSWRNQSVSDSMTAAPISVQQSTSLGEACRRMAHGGFRRLPVVDGAGHSVGIVSIRDIIRHLSTRVS